MGNTLEATFFPFYHPAPDGGRALFDAVAIGTSARLIHLLLPKVK